MTPHINCLPNAERQYTDDLINQDNLAKVLKWIDEDPKPWPTGEGKKDNYLIGWLTGKEKEINYRIYLATRLRARFADIDSNFRTLFPDYVYGQYKSMQNDVLPTAVQIVNLLDLAKATLSRGDYEKHELLLIASLLDMAEENMVWINSDAELETEILDVGQRLKEAPNLDNRAVYEDKLDSIKAEIKEKGLAEKDWSRYRAILFDIYWICNTKTWEEMVNNGLQIERLRKFRNWGVVLLGLVLLIGFPAGFNIGIFKNWSLHNNTTAVYSTISATGTQPISIWAILGITAVGIAIIGGTGGYLSGLIQARDSKTNLALYEGDVLLSELRVIFGAFAALISFTLLSWNVLSGIILNNSPGPFILIAFLSGFSERYFLKLLKIDSENDTQSQQLHAKKPS